MASARNDHVLNLVTFTKTYSHSIVLYSYVRGFSRPWQCGTAQSSSFDFLLPSDWRAIRLDRRGRHRSDLPSPEATADLRWENPRSNTTTTRQHRSMPSGRSRWQSVGDTRWIWTTQDATGVGRDVLSWQELSRLLQMAESDSLSNEQTRTIHARQYARDRGHSLWKVQW